MGERTPVALLDAPASARLAVAEAVTNMLSADIARIGDIRLSANWMAACGEPGEDAALYATVRAVGEEFCPALGIAIPVGKDSLSMKTVWQEDGATRSVVAPVSLIVSAFAPVARRAPHADAGAAARPGADVAVARRPRREPQPPRRLGAGAGVRRAGWGASRPGRPGAAASGSPRRWPRCASVRCCWPTTTGPTADCS